MPTLDWIGKSAVVKHHEEVPFHLLRQVPELSVGDPDSGNLLIQGDNLLALKALLPYYGEQVRCIYIDPPYNTGNESWVYSDNTSSPEITAWLGQVVGKEAEDLSRHDKWLCMMYPRLVLLRELLSEDGSLWMSIDDNEVHHARAILDEIFGPQNFITTVIWEKIFSPKSSARHLSANHDFILLYAKNASIWDRNLLPRTAAQDKRYNNPDNDPRGPWTSGDLSARNYYSLGTYSITGPSGRVISGPPKGTYWRVSEETFKELDADNRIWWGKSRSNVPRLKRFLSEVQGGVVPQTIWYHKEVGNTQEAKKEVVRVLPDAAQVFNTPKPTRLIHRILQIATNPGDLVLDSFAGSGTTGDAVLRFNAETDGAELRFILVELDADIAPSITAERLKCVIEGWGDEPGVGGSFRYCTLGEPLFDTAGALFPKVSFAELARHVFYVETDEPLPRDVQLASPLIGVAQDTAVYLLYDGVLDSKAGESNAVLTPEVLSQLPPHPGPKVVYGTGCLLSDHRLRDEQITFRQIPYDIRTR